MSPQKIVIENKVQALAQKRGLDRDAFIGLCLQSQKTTEGRRLKADTAGRVYDGETGISLITASLVAAALGVELSEIFEVK